MNAIQNGPDIRYPLGIPSLRELAGRVDGDDHDTSQNSDDANNHQKLDKREAFPHAVGYRWVSTLDNPSITQRLNPSGKLSTKGLFLL
jgi:hypothetical protein